jgi:hypothetical protein
LLSTSDQAKFLLRSHSVSPDKEKTEIIEKKVVEVKKRGLVSQKCFVVFASVNCLVENCLSLNSFCASTNCHEIVFKEIADTFLNVLLSSSKNLKALRKCADLFAFHNLRWRKSSALRGVESEVWRMSRKLEIRKMIIWLTTNKGCRESTKSTQPCRFTSLERKETRVRIVHI